MWVTGLWVVIPPTWQVKVVDSGEICGKTAKILHVTARGGKEKSLPLLVVMLHFRIFSLSSRKILKYNIKNRK